MTVAPWPFQNDTDEESREGFLLERAPVAMVELWDFAGDDGEVEEEKFNRPDECVLYGGFDMLVEDSFQVCIGDRGVDGELIAGKLSDRFETDISVLMSK